MTDFVAWPILDELLECLTSAFLDYGHPSPPKLICHRSGNGQSIPQVNPTTRKNECCGGLAWVRLLTSYPTTGDAQLSPVTRIDDCYAGEALQVELGALRCWPHLGGYATCDDWATNANLVAQDTAALRRAVRCCFVPLHESAQDAVGVIRGQWRPAGISGQCVGGIVPVTIGPLDPDDCCEVTSPGSP